MYFIGISNCALIDMILFFDECVWFVVLIHTIVYLIHYIILASVCAVIDMIVFLITLKWYCLLHNCSADVHIYIYIYNFCTCICYILFMCNVFCCSMLSQVRISCQHLQKSFEGCWYFTFFFFCSFLSALFKGYILSLHFYFIQLEYPSCDGKQTDRGELFVSNSGVYWQGGKVVQYLYWDLYFWNCWVQNFSGSISCKALTLKKRTSLSIVKDLCFANFYV